jgi:hypothetical protein
MIEMKAKENKTPKKNDGWNGRWERWTQNLKHWKIMDENVVSE